MAAESACMRRLAIARRDTRHGTVLANSQNEASCAVRYPYLTSLIGDGGKPGWNPGLLEPS